MKYNIINPNLIGKTLLFVKGRKCSKGYAMSVEKEEIWPAGSWVTYRCFCGCGRIEKIFEDK